MIKYEDEQLLEVGPAIDDYASSTWTPVPGDIVIASNIRMLDYELTRDKKYTVHGTSERPYVIDDNDIGHLFTDIWHKYFIPITEKVIPFADKVNTITSKLSEAVIAKERNNTTLEHTNVFSKISSTEQLLMHLDDKLNHIRTQGIAKDKNILQDLLEDLVLLQILINKDN